MSSLTSWDDPAFTKFVDNMILENKDADFAEGLKRLDAQAMSKGCSFYQWAFIMFKKKLAENRAMKWNEARK